MARTVSEEFRSLPDAPPGERSSPMSFQNDMGRLGVALGATVDDGPLELVERPIASALEELAHGVADRTAPESAPDATDPRPLRSERNQRYFVPRSDHRSREGESRGRLGHLEREEAFGGDDLDPIRDRLLVADLPVGIVVRAKEPAGAKIHFGVGHHPGFHSLLRRDQRPDLVDRALDEALVYQRDFTGPALRRAEARAKNGQGEQDQRSGHRDAQSAILLHGTAWRGGNHPNCTPSRAVILRF